MESVAPGDALRKSRMPLIRFIAVALSLCFAFEAMAADTTTPTWKRGIEHQRQADLGNGTFLNPVLAGDRPDPSVLKDGDDYYLTLSSFTAYPGLPVWHSRDLINWQPIGHAITRNVGSIWAPDPVKHPGRALIHI